MTAGGGDAYPMPALLVREGLATVADAFAHDAGHDMTVANLGHRERWRLDLTDAAGRPHVLFMKRYHREPLKWRLERLWTYGRGRSPARIELDNIHACHAAGVLTIAQAVCGQEAGRSFIVVSAVAGEALEQCAEPFLRDRAESPDQIAAFTDLLSDLVRRFHEQGYVHRDLYTSHVFLSQCGRRVQLCLIDLARMFRPRWRKFRWRAKDLAQLKYSMPAEWVSQWWDRFLQRYLGSAAAASANRYARAIDAKVAFIRRQVGRRRRREEGGGTS